MTPPPLRELLQNSAESSVAYAPYNAVDRVKTLLERLRSHSAQDAKHSHNVGECLYALAPLARLDPEEMRLAGQLHDIGKLAVSQSILSQPGKLSAAQWYELDSHAATSASIALALGFDPRSNTYAACSEHHTQGNNTTSRNPFASSHNSIPLFTASQRRAAQLTAVADVADALTCGRSYRPGLPLPLAAAILRQEFENTPAHRWVEPTIEYLSSFQR